MSEVKRMKYCVNGEWLDSKTDKYMDIYLADFQQP